MATGDQLKARRHAREIVGEMRWRGMSVPALYVRMADEFQDLVRSGECAAWVTASQKPAVIIDGVSHVVGSQKPAVIDRRSHIASAPGSVAPERLGAQVTSQARRTAHPALRPPGRAAGVA